jgi:hypothetical protein
MQTVARQLQQLDYNNGNRGVFYVVHVKTTGVMQLVLS